MILPLALAFLLLAVLALGYVARLRFLLQDPTPHAEPAATSHAPDDPGAGGPPRAALITGASGGIGSEVALCLAQRGFAPILLGRDSARLHALAHTLHQRYCLTSHILLADLSLPGAAPAIAAELARRNLHVTVLANCAGFAVHGNVDHADPAALRDMLHVNILALTELTRLLLPPMLARGSGYVLNISSVAAFMPGPLLAAYFASKAYVLSFSEALAQEVAGRGVSVTASCPGPTDSHFSRRAGLERTRAFSGRVMQADIVARISVDALFRRRRVVIPSLLLKLQLIPARWLPRRALAVIAQHYHTTPPAPPPPASLPDGLPRDKPLSSLPSAP